MKWYNNDRTRMLDLESVNGYVFTDSANFLKNTNVNAKEDEQIIADFTEYGDRLEILVNGTPYIIRGPSAREIYDLLNEDTKKELLKG